MSYNVQRTASQVGTIPSDRISSAFIALLRISAWLLIILSVFGTFYGSRGLDVPLTQPLEIIRDIIALPVIAGIALLGQGLLSLVQWGSRQLARKDRRWWFAYLAALALSVWWNWAAYGDPLIAVQVPWLIAFGLVLGGDVFPEMTLVKG